MKRSIGDVGLECLICHDGRFRSLMSHLIHIHGVKGRDYLKQFNLPKGSLVIEEVREGLVQRGYKLVREGKLGTPESQVKAHIAQRKWIGEHPEEARGYALKASRAGDTARREFWTPAEREKVSKRAKVTSKELWKNPEYRKKMEGNLARFNKMQREKSDKLQSLRKICLQCHKHYRPRFRDSQNRFMTKIFCEQSCRHSYQRQHGLSFSAWGKVSAKLADQANKTLYRL